MAVEDKLDNVEDAIEEEKMSAANEPSTKLDQLRRRMESLGNLHLLIVRREQSPAFVGVDKETIQDEEMGIT